MLYDPKWEVETKADPFTLESLITWLEMQPANVGYEYMNCEGKCLFGLYCFSRGIPWSEVRGIKEESIAFKEFVYHKVACTTPWTFGAALKRAQALTR